MAGEKVLPEDAGELTKLAQEAVGYAVQVILQDTVKPESSSEAWIVEEIIDLIAYDTRLDTPEMRLEAFDSAIAQLRPKYPDSSLHLYTWGQETYERQKAVYQMELRARAHAARD